MNFIMWLLCGLPKSLGESGYWLNQLFGMNFGEGNGKGGVLEEEEDSVGSDKNDEVSWRVPEFLSSIMERMGLPVNKDSDDEKTVEGILSAWIRCHLSGIGFSDLPPGGLTQKNDTREVKGDLELVQQNREDISVGAPLLIEVHSHIHLGMPGGLFSSLFGREQKRTTSHYLVFVHSEAERILEHKFLCLRKRDILELKMNLERYLNSKGFLPEDFGSIADTDDGSPSEPLTRVIKMVFEGKVLKTLEGLRSRFHELNSSQWVVEEEERRAHQMQSERLLNSCAAKHKERRALKDFFEGGHTLNEKFCILLDSSNLDFHVGISRTPSEHFSKEIQAMVRDLKEILGECHAVVIDEILEIQDQLKKLGSVPMAEPFEYVPATGSHMERFLEEARENNLVTHSIDSNADDPSENPEDGKSEMTEEEQVREALDRR